MPVESQMPATGDDTRETQVWLPTYTALCMALLAFAVMLHAMSALDPHKDILPAQLRKQVAGMQTRAFNDIRAFITQNGMEAGVEAILEETAIILRLPEGMLFTPGTAHILPTGLKMLHHLRELFVIQGQQTINILAYTDDNPLPPGTRFKDNWELSALRAAHILRHLLAQGIEATRLTAAGFGEHEPLFPNTTEENRVKNRRIEFVLERRLEKE